MIFWGDIFVCLSGHVRAGLFAVFTQTVKHVYCNLLRVMVCDLRLMFHVYRNNGIVPQFS